MTLNATSQAGGRLLLYHMEDWRDASEDNDCVRRLGKARIVCEEHLVLFSLFVFLRVLFIPTQGGDNI